MTPEPPFEPTLEVPLAWIRELADDSNDGPEVLCLSYMPHLHQRAEELECTLDDVESDLRNGYSFRRLQGERGAYYVLSSEWFTLFVNPQLGKTSGADLAVIGKIDRHPEARSVGPGLLPIQLVPIRNEPPASPEVLLSYQASLQRLANPPPPEPRPPKPKPDEREGLWRYAALAELLRLLRRRVDHAPRLRLTCTMLRAADDGLGAEDSDAPLRLETTEPLRGWRPETPVTAYVDNKAAFTTRVRDIEGQVIELDAPDVPQLRAGTPITLEQLPRFAMAAHQRALELFLRREVAGNWEHLRDFLVAPENLVPGETLVPDAASTSAERLTPEQRRAVERAISTPHAFFIQGPPGTGKTTVITEIVQRLVRRGERVLLLSNTHVAVDEVLRRIDKKDDVLPVRLTWSTAKVDPEVRKYAYEHAVSGLVDKVLGPRQEQDHFWKQKEADLGPGARDRLEALRRVEERWLKGGREPGARGELQEEIGAALLAAANLICATTVGVAKKDFAHVGNVDTLIVDEASRVTDAELLIGAVRARRWILVGDEHQLPPHVEPDVEYFLLALAACSMVERRMASDLMGAVDRLAQDWEDEEELHAFRKEAVLEVATEIVENDWDAHYKYPFNLALEWHGEGTEEPFRELLKTIRDFFVRSVFERAVEACPAKLREPLTVQRRMIEPLSRFVRDPVYKGKYVTPTAAVLALSGVKPLQCDAFPKPVTFLNTQYHEEEAAEELVGSGFVNPLEAEWVVEACDRFEASLGRRGGGDRVTASILCFYRDQARRIRDMLGERKRAHERLHFRVIDAIDRIQGQESDIVFISFCRARNPKRMLGPTFGMWLQDLRRLNVAFTRARRSLVLVGHRPTLERLGKYQPFYENMLGLFAQNPTDMQMINDFGRRRGRR